MRGGPLIVVLAVVHFAGAASAAAQEIRAAISPDTVRVGDVFRAAVRVELLPGHRAVFPDSLSLPPELESAGRRSETSEELPDGRLRVTAVYPLTAWRPGEAALPAAAVRIEGPDVAQVVHAALPTLSVRSVLPADTAGIGSRPPKDVVGANRVVWPFLLATLALLVAAGLVLWYLGRRRRRAPEPAVEEVASPRERALAALDEAHGLGLVERGEFHAFYSRVAEAVRRYLDELNPAWGADLTTSEVVKRLDGAVEERWVSELARLLGAADLVKFARHRPTTADALAEWQAARGWVAGFDWSGPAPEPAAELVPSVAESQEVA